MNRLAGETACPTHRQVVWLQCGAGSVACLPRCCTDSFTPSQSRGVLDALWDKLQLVWTILDYSARQAKAYPTRGPQRLRHYWSSGPAAAGVVRMEVEPTKMVPATISRVPTQRCGETCSPRNSLPASAVSTYPSAVTGNT